MLDPLTNRKRPILHASDDILRGLNRSWIWTAMATQDIRLKYRGSMLGPLWNTLTTAIMIGSMGFVYSLIFKMDVTSYLPFLTLGLVPWQFLSNVIAEGCQTFIAAQAIMQQARMPLSLHVFRVVYRNILVLGHNIIIVIAVMLLFQLPLAWASLLVFPGIVMLIINAVWVCFLLGMLSARYRDVPPIVTNFMQMVFFVTPIFWQPSSLGQYRVIADLNPLYAMIDIVRSPLLGELPDAYSWLMVGGVTVVGSLIAFLAFAKFRSRLVYWV